VSGYTILTKALAVCVTVMPLGAQQHGNHSAPMYHYPRFSPDGMTIITTAMSGAGVEVQLISVAGGPAVTVPLEGVEPSVADWTAAGELLILVDGPNNTQRGFVVDRGGRNRRPVPVDSVRGATPDSALLVFESAHGGGNAIFTMDRHRATARQLTRGFWAEQPSLSPDGRRIVFEKRTDPNNMLGSEIVLMTPDGRGQLTIAAGTDPSWSPDGRRILFKTPDANGELWVALVDPNTRIVRRLAKGVHPHWSPDGRMVAFMRDGAVGRTDIYVVAVDGSRERCLTCS
jgi:hypothetical protein